jgi:hypothetical protein
VFGLPVPAGVRDSVARLALLAGRTPDAATTVASTTAYASSATTLAAFAEAILATPDAAARLTTAPDGFVDGLYTGVLGRPATAVEHAHWVGQLAAGRSRADLAIAFTESPEAVARTGTAPPQPPPARIVPGASLGVSDSVLRTYAGLLGRFASAAELQATVRRYQAGTSLVTIVGEVIASPEHQARRGGLSDDAFVDAMYVDVLGRAADPGGRVSHLARLSAGGTRPEVAVAMLQSSEAVARTGTAAPEVPPPPPPPPPPPTTGAIAPPPAAAPRAPSGGVLALGDSVMLGAAGALRSAIPGIAVDAKVSRQLGQGTAILRSLRDSGRLPGTVVIHLGNNGPISGGACDAMLQAASGRRIVVVTLKVPRDYEGGNNAVLRSCAARHGARIADWSSAARSASGLLARDGYHLNPSGARLYARVVAGAL